MTNIASCDSGSCSVVSMLQATNETYVACGIPIRDKTKTLIGLVASIGALALLMVSMGLIDHFVSAQAQLGWDDLLIGLSGVRVPAVLKVLPPVVD